MSRMSTEERARDAFPPAYAGDATAYRQDREASDAEAERIRQDRILYWE